MLEIVIVLFAVFIAQVTPGPNMMAVASASLGNGRRAGLVTTLGISVGIFLWAVLFTTGGGAFIKAFPQSLSVMKMAGGSYLLFLAASAVRRAATRKGDANKTAQAHFPDGRAFTRGFFVVSTNPKAALVWIAVSAYLAPLALSFLQYVLFGLVVGLSGALVFGTYACLFSMAFAVRGYRTFFRSVEMMFGATFGAVGAKLVVDGVQEIRAGF